MCVCRSRVCFKLSTTILLTCLFAKFISLPLTSTILNFSWRTALGTRSISVVPFINRNTLFWNFWILFRWHSLLLIDGNGAYSNVGLIMLLNSVRFTSSGALRNLLMELKEALAFLRRAFVWWLPLRYWSVL